MAHFILEYSNNLSADDIKATSLFAELHKAMDESGIFPLAGLRSRAFSADQYYVANGDERMAYIHLSFKIGTGRSEEEQAQAFNIVKSLVLAHFESLQSTRPVALSMEQTELPAVLRYNANNIREFL